jgi:hypothetical protein
MSNRFHSKFHRQNHHTYTSATNPDAGHDPIASTEQPFWGDFVLAGALSCVAPASAVAGYFNSNHTALCAIAGERGEYIYSFGNIGLEVYSAQSTAISAVAPYIGANISSRVYGINVYGGQYGINVYGGQYGGNYYSPIRALSAYGGQYALDAYSPLYGVNVYGGQYGGNYYSPIRALSANGGIVGLEVYSPISAINAFGGIVGLNVYSPIRAISAYSGNIGIDVYASLSGIHANAGQVAGNFYSPITGIRTHGNLVGIDVYSSLTAINAYGGQVAAALSSPVIALSTGGGGVVTFDNPIGIFKTPQKNYPTSPNIVFDINGNSYFDGNITITGDLSTLGRLTYLDTFVQITSSLQVINHSASAGATFIQYSNQPILVCYDGDISTSVSSFIVDGSNKGWVALGTNTPTAPFNIVKDNSSSQANNQPQIRISDDNSTTKLAIGTPRTNFSNSNIGTETNHNFDIITNNITRLTVLNTGNVGIGTSTPNVTLTVNGQVSANNTATFNTLAIKDLSTTSNATMGVSALVAGSATITTTAVQSNSRIFLTTQIPGGTVGSPYVFSRIAGTSFTIKSTSGTDTSNVAWFIVQPS